MRREDTIGHWRRVASSGKAQNRSLSSTCRRMPCFAVPYRRQRYNSVPGLADGIPLRRARWANHPSGTPPARETSEDRLDSWKEIAAYLNRDVTTVQRWEKREGMPVHRHLHDRMGSVYASRAELDAWTQSRNLRPAQENGNQLPSPDPPASPLPQPEIRPLEPGGSLPCCWPRPEPHW